VTRERDSGSNDRPRDAGDRVITPAGMRIGVPVLAGVFTLPSWQQSLIAHGATVESSAIRFVVALPVAWVLLSLVQKAAKAPAEQDPAAELIAVENESVGLAAPIEPAIFDQQ
jgi:hypothetical protein